MSRSAAVTARRLAWVAMGVFFVWAIIHALHEWVGVTALQEPRKKTVKEWRER